MAQLLGNVAVGSTVYLNEKGSPQPYLVVHQGLPSSMYDSSCNGTWLLRQDLSNSTTRWSRDRNWFSASLINSISISNFEASIRNVIKSVKIPYCDGGGSSTVLSGSNGYTCKSFLLSSIEVGLTTSIESVFPVDGAKLSYFESGNGTSAKNKRIAKLNGSNECWWTRSPSTYDSFRAIYINTDGGYGYTDADDSYHIRPAMIMPPNLIVDDSNNITSTTIPNITTFTVPSLAMAGQSIPLSWSSISVSGYTVTYQLQRNVNNEGWTTIQSSLSTSSYTDTAQSSWGQVQYQVAPVVSGAVGIYKTSSIIPVKDSNNLVISGQDGDLGTITANIPYTVSSNTGNPISLTRKVNQVNVANVNIDSGFAYNIPIFDLPTGTNTIQLTAQVQAPSGQVNETRTWTYTKTPMQFPDTGGIAQLVQNGQNIWPLTLAESVRVPTYLGGSLDKALELLSTNTDFAVIAVGEYTGIGTYGQNNPNTLTFSSTPLMVLIYGENNTLIISSTNTSSTAYTQGTQAKWYSTISAEDQMNTSGTIYSYIAIG